MRRSRFCGQNTYSHRRYSYIAIPTTTPYYNDRLFDTIPILLYGYYTRDFHSTENDTFGVENQIDGESRFAVNKIPQTKIIVDV